MKKYLYSVLAMGVLFLAGASTASANPTVTSISPTTAKIGDMVTVEGTGFDSSSTIVFIGGSTCSNAPSAVINTVSPTSLSFSVPLGISGTCGVAVNAPYPYPAPYYIPGNVSNSLPLNIIDIAPTITNIAPATVHVGDTVTLTGTNFDWETTVQFTDNYAGGLGGYWANLKTFTPTTISFVVPFGVKGLRTLQVRRTYSELKSNTIQLNILPIAPIIDSIKPTTVRAGLTESFLYGDNFDSDSRIIIDGGTELALSQCRISKAPGICFYVPTGVAVGTHTMFIKQKDSGLTSGTISFTVTDQPILSTLYGNLYAGGKMVATGVGFDSYSAALIDGSSGTVVPRLTEGYGMSDSAFAFMLPAGIAKGVHTLGVKQTDSGKVSNSLSFTVIDGPSGPPSTRTDPPVLPPTGPGTVVAPSPSPLVTSNPPTPAPAPYVTPGSAAQSALDALRAKIKDAQQKASQGTVVSNLAAQALAGQGTPAGVASTACAKITRNLGLKAKDTTSDKSVTSLQTFLVTQGYLKTTPTGYFGVMTLSAVKVFQKANGISPTGFVGVLTRAKITALSCGQ